MANHTEHIVEGNSLDFISNDGGEDLQSRINATVTDSALFSIYNFAIDELRMQLSLCVSEGKNRLDLMDAFVWQFILPDTFVPLLVNPTQEAAVIFAHFCVTLKRFDEHWWSQGWGVADIQGLGDFGFGS